MKKVLLTTTALTLLAGAAAAEVSIAGTSRIGITSTGGTTVTTYRTRINVSMSGTTDGGLTFGAFTRAQMGTGTGVFSGSRVWVSNGTATLTLGNAGGAIAQNAGIWGCAVGFTGSCADMASQTFSWASFSSAGGGANVARLDFALGSASISLSGGNGNDTEVAASFSMGNASVSVGYDAGAVSTGGTQLGLSMDAGSAKVGLHYAAETGGATTGYTAYVSAPVGAGSIYAFAGNAITAAATTSQVYGVSYSQSLGGGATAAVSLRSVGGTVTTDAGLKFAF